MSASDPLPQPRGDLPSGAGSAAEPAYWDIRDIQFHCRVSRTTAWALASREPRFPAPVVLGPKNLVWPRVEVVAFMEARRDPRHYVRPSPAGARSAAEPEVSFISGKRKRRRLKAQARD